MAVTITEFGGVGGYGVHGPIIDVTSVVAQQVIDVDEASDAFNAGTGAVQIDADESVRVEFGPDPDGEGITFPVDPGMPVQFGVQPGWKVYAIAVGGEE